MTDDTTLVPVSEETRTWARTLMDGVRAVQELHQAERSEDDNGEYLVCVECTRLSRENSGGDEFLEEPWPCPTATALGITDHPLL